MWNANALFGLECNRFLYFHCFTKCGVSSENRERAVTNEDDPFKELKNEIDQLRGSHTEVVPTKITTKDLVDVDDKVLTTEPFTDEEFLADFRELQVEQNNSDNRKDNNDAIDEPAKCKKKMNCWMTSTCCRRFHYLSMRGEVSCMQFAINCSVKLIRT